MKANIERITHGMSANHRKEKGFIGSVHGIAVVDGKATSACELRLYATSSRIYACFWIYAGNALGNGSGFAGGVDIAKNPPPPLLQSGPPGLNYQKIFLAVEWLP